MMKALVGMLLSAMIAVAGADTWSFESSEREFRFSEGFRFLVTVDASQSTQSPDFYVRVYDGERLLAHYPGFNFEHVIASPDEKLFVALSNRGVPGTAAAVFARDGGFRWLVTHGLADFDYCGRSVILVRRWYDEKNPDVRFGDTGKADAITLRDCQGQRVSLLEAAGQRNN